jgi:hypothetical protein
MSTLTERSSGSTAATPRPRPGSRRRKPRPSNAGRSHSIPTRSGCSTTIGSCGSSAAPPRLWYGSDAFVFSPAPTAPPRTPQGKSVSDTAEWRLSLHCGAPASTLCGHYSATELVAAGVDLRTVAGRLGHGNGGATALKVYAAWVDEADRRAAATMASIMPRPVPLQQARGPYEKIADSLRDDIQTGRLKPSD